MTRSRRILIGAIVMIAYVLLYALIASGVLAMIERPPFWAELALYVFLGIVWILPLKPLFKWMGRGAPDS